MLFLREGATVLISDISQPAIDKAVNKLKEIIPEAVSNVSTMKCDVSKESDVQQVVESLDAKGGVDIMFNNAGIMHGDDDGEFVPLMPAPI